MWVLNQRPAGNPIQYLVLAHLAGGRLGSPASSIIIVMRLAKSCTWERSTGDPTPFIHGDFTGNQIQVEDSAETCGNMWKHVEKRGNLLKHVETCGETCRNMWGNMPKHVETCRNLWKRIKQGRFLHHQRVILIIKCHQLPDTPVPGTSEAPTSPSDRGTSSRSTAFWYATCGGSSGDPWWDMEEDGAVCETWYALLVDSGSAYLHDSVVFAADLGVYRGYRWR